MKLQTALTVLCLSAALVLIACSGGMNNSSTQTAPTAVITPAPQPAPQPAPTPVPAPVVNTAHVHSGASVGTHVYAAAAQPEAAFNWSLIPRAYAQTPAALSLSQSWNGTCASFAKSTQSTASVLIYGLGQSSDQACSSYYNDTNGSSAAMNAKDGQLVIGSGSLSNLVAWAAASGVKLSATASSGLIHIWIQRGSTTLDSGIECQLTNVGSYYRCSSTTTFAVLDGDLVVATLTSEVGDTISGLNVVFTK